MIADKEHTHLTFPMYGNKHPNQSVIRIYSIKIPHQVCNMISDKDHTHSDFTVWENKHPDQSVVETNHILVYCYRQISAISQTCHNWHSREKIRLLILLVAVLTSIIC